MIRQLRIEELSEDGGAVEIGQLMKGEVILGRGPGCSVTLDNTAISRQHGMFVQIRQHWFYKDLGSTNGSWLNGLPLQEGQWKLVRAGDLMQIADVAIRLRALTNEGADSLMPPSHGISSAIVFSNNNFQDEYPIPENGPIVVVGGPRADLRLSETEESEVDPRLVIERRDGNLEISSLGEIPVFVNEEQVSEPMTLNDRDLVRISNYLILMNDPARAEPLKP
jgi:hypothetical protein